MSKFKSEQVLNKKIVLLLQPNQNPYSYCKNLELIKKTIRRSLISTYFMSQCCKNFKNENKA